MNVIKGVVFDIDDTLYDYEHCNKIAVNKIEKYTCDAYGLSGEEFHKFYKMAKEEVKKQLGNTGSSHNRLLYAQIFLEKIGQSPVKDALNIYNIYWDSMLENMQLYPYVLSLMKILKSKNIKIAVLTDLTVHIQHRKIRKLGLEEYIDFFVTSEEVGEEKPSPKAFERVILKTGFAPAELLMIGDSKKKDIEGAKNVGMHAILFLNEQKYSMDKRCLEYINDQLDKEQV